jgi:hypothetical protein
MRMIIEARIDDGVGGDEAIRLAEFERLDGDLRQLGLNFADGRSLVHEGGIFVGRIGTWNPIANTGPTTDGATGAACQSAAVSQNRRSTKL